MIYTNTFRFFLSSFIGITVLGCRLAAMPLGGNIILYKIFNNAVSN